MNDQELIDAEVARIKAGPQSGKFTFIHHRGPVIETSANVMERVNFILHEKVPEQIFDRVRHIYYVDPATLPLVYQELYQEWQEAYKAMEKDYRVWEEARRVGREAYKVMEKDYEVWQEAHRVWEKADEVWEKDYEVWQEAHRVWQEGIVPYVRMLIPNCAWNGETILQ